MLRGPHLVLKVGTRTKVRELRFRLEKNFFYNEGISECKLVARGNKAVLTLLQTIANLRRHRKKDFFSVELSSSICFKRYRSITEILNMDFEPPKKCIIPELSAHIVVNN
ncbi:MAG: hypothetical protein MHPSP_002977, partial [Paramarteilia canceri]